MKASDLANRILTIVLTGCALMITGLVVRRELASGQGPAASRMDPRHIGEEWRSYVTGLRRAGPRDATVKIVEFSDFQCPYCATMAARLDTLRAAYPGALSVEYRHFPLRSHPHAVTAALASDCAHEQGRFWQMHDALFQEQAVIGQVPWMRYARSAGVADTAAFARCMERIGPAPALHEDTLAARRLGTEATPLLLINDYRVVGAVPLDSLRAYVERAQRKGR